MDILQVNHINGIKTDDRLENLEWVTSKQNIEHAFRTGLCNYRRGEHIHLAKLKEKDIIEIKNLIPIKTLKEIAKMYNVTLGNIWAIKHKKSWKHINRW